MGIVKGGGHFSKKAQRNGHDPSLLLEDIAKERGYETAELMNTYSESHTNVCNAIDEAIARLEKNHS